MKKWPNQIVGWNEKFGKHKKAMFYKKNKNGPAYQKQ